MFVEKLKTLYNADLANGLGNLVARVAKLAENVSLSFSSKHTPKLFKEVETYLNDYRFNDALSNIWGRIKIVDQEINQDEPWKIEDNKKLEEKLWNYSRAIRDVAFDLQPFLPQTAEKILKQFSGEIKSSVPLFPRFV